MQIRKITEGADYSYVQRPGRHQEKYPSNAQRVRVIEKGVERTRDDWGYYGQTAERKDGVRIQLYTTSHNEDGTTEYTLNGQERTVRSRGILAPWPEHQAQREVHRIRHEALRERRRRETETKQAQVRALAERLDALGISYYRGYDATDLRINSTEEVEKLLALVPEQVEQEAI